MEKTLLNEFKIYQIKKNLNEITTIDDRIEYLDTKILDLECLFEEYSYSDIFVYFKYPNLRLKEDKPAHPLRNWDLIWSEHKSTAFTLISTATYRSIDNQLKLEKDFLVYTKKNWRFSKFIKEIWFI